MVVYLPTAPSLDLAAALFLATAAVLASSAVKNSVGPGLWLKILFSWPLLPWLLATR